MTWDQVLSLPFIVATLVLGVIAGLIVLKLHRPLTSVMGFIWATKREATKLAKRKTDLEILNMAKDDALYVEVISYKDSLNTCRLVTLCFLGLLIYYEMPDKQPMTLPLNDAVAFALAFCMCIVTYGTYTKEAKAKIKAASLIRELANQPRNEKLLNKHTDIETITKKIVGGEFWDEATAADILDGESEDNYVVKKT